MTDETTRAPDFEAQAREIARAAGVVRLADLPSTHSGYALGWVPDPKAVAAIASALRSAYAARLERAAGEAMRDGRPGDQAVLAAASRRIRALAVPR